jgi:hypothetical protein
MREGEHLGYHRPQTLFRELYTHSRLYVIYLMMNTTDSMQANQVLYTYL